MSNGALVFALCGGCGAPPRAPWAYAITVTSQAVSTILLKKNTTLLILGSKEILQSELHNPRIQGIADLAEHITAEHRIYGTLRTAATSRASRACNTTRPKAIQDVVSLGANFQPAGFLETEYSRQARVERPGSWTQNTVMADISDRARIRQRESRRVEI